MGVEGSSPFAFFFFCKNLFAPISVREGLILTSFYLFSKMQTYPFTPEEWAICIKVLKDLKDNPFHNPDNQTFKTLVSAICKKAKKDKSNLKSDYARKEDVQKLAQTTIVGNARHNITFFTQQTVDPKDLPDLSKAQYCYVCDQPYTKLHFFYHKLCPDCASYNYSMRGVSTDFKDYQVVITGGRVKIGYATALKFLRSGAKVLVTTRFPAVAWAQFKQEADAREWLSNLRLYGLDLRNMKAVHDFIAFCKKHTPHIDILVNNAAQTIKYPIAYYQPLIQNEQNQLPAALENGVMENITPIAFDQNQLPELTTLSDVPLNRFGQPVDYREHNSWIATLQDIGLEELLEVNLINQISPYLLISGLSEWLERSPRAEKFILNVTSSEGQFSYANKTIHHPHTNMTKAALNMLTRTSAAEYAEKQIFMNAVDVGWVSTGAPEQKRARLFDSMKIPPLDPVDGAMRIIHPILEILKGNKNLVGKLIKNYKVVDW
jgi:NAD(P)-dependent dehydrogenase (short-subunit alcohol dehydrogenase family)